MLSLENALYVRIEQLPNGPKPLPLQNGFNKDTAYRALGMFNPSETSDAYFILSNDRNETWFICNRHLRTVAVAPRMLDFRCALHTFTGLNPCIADTPMVTQPAAQAPRHPVEPDEGAVPVVPPNTPPQHQPMVRLA